MNLDEIRERSRKCEEERDADRSRIDRWALAAVASAADVPALIGEIERLRAALVDEQGSHAKTMDNFEAEAESWLEERTRLLDLLARRDAELEHAKTAKVAAYAALREAAAERQILVDTIAEYARMEKP